MKISPAKENILKKVRKALSTPVPLPFPQSEGSNSVFQAPTDELEIIFAEEFSKLQGRFVYCANDSELIAQLTELIRQMNWQEIYCVEDVWKNKLTALGYSNFSKKSLAQSDAAITGCEVLVARTGTIVMSTGQPSGRTTSVYTPVHICIAYISQLVYDVKDGIQFLKEKYKGNLPSSITFATGPSRTADIEKTLVVGVHGPKEVFLFLLEAPKG